WVHRNGLQAVAAYDRPRERALLHTEALRAEVRTVAEHREGDAAQAMGYRDDGRFVAPAGAELGEVGVERMARPRRVVRRFAEHGAQLGGAAFGEVPLPIAVAGLLAGGHRARLSGDVL